MTWKTWTIKDGTDTATIANFGGVLLSWQVEGLFPDPLWVASESGDEIPLLKQTRELIDGYRDEEEARSLDGFRSALLAPWPNRIAEAKYSFQGKEYDLDDEFVGGPLALHGLAHSVEFQPIEVGDSYLVLEGDLPRTKGYPFSVRLRVEYRIKAEKHQLEMNLTATNTGDEDAPVSLGWHPYLHSQNGGANTVMVTIPARVGIGADKNLIPLPDIACFQPLANPVCFAHREDLDYGLTGLVVNEDGSAEAVLYHADGCTTKMRMLNVDSKFGHSGFQVFSAQGLVHRPGQSVAVEPVLNMTDAFNRDECAEDITVSAGGERKLQVVMEFSRGRRI